MPSILKLHICVTPLLTWTMGCRSQIWPTVSSLGIRAAGKSVEVTYASKADLKAMAALPPAPEVLRKVFLAEVSSLKGPTLIVCDRQGAHMRVAPHMHLCLSPSANASK